MDQLDHWINIYLIKLIKSLSSEPGYKLDQLDHNENVY